jgi:hypothetical protein
VSIVKQTGALALLAAVFGAVACGAPNAGDTQSAASQVQRTGDAEKGRRLFAEKGCVICHSVNGVGGKAAPPLDAQTEYDVADPVGFASRMWRGAPAMIELQSLELGYSIWLDPQEMVDLAVFAADAAEQKKLTLSDIDQDLADSFLDERFWEVEDWSDFLESGQEGRGDPPPGENEDE